MLGIGISTGIAFLPPAAESSITSQVTQTATVSSTITNVVTATSTQIQVESSSTVTQPLTTIVTTVASTTTAVSSSSVVSSVTAPCGSSGVYCGSASIRSVSLTVGSNISTLEITLAEIGNDYIGSATVYLNGTVIGAQPASEYQPPGNIILNIQANQTATLVLVIPTSSIAIRVGMTYPVLVYAWLGPPGQRASSGLPALANVTAS